MKFAIGSKVKVLKFNETFLDASADTIGCVGEVESIDLGQGDYFYHVVFENDSKGWNYKEDQLVLEEESN